ncbi:TetR/AcrR family transcriptional regulator (plasmid) [Salipiger sp. H15]|uniref:TetR/AcrR family transcriptional regulator n=1 Tax=Alloyangia sp. H15 TaxID=3029062 RepID=A0AAU8AT94_9RHOB
MAKTAARKRLDPAERRTQILDEMLKLCANQHFASITMRQLAGACGVNIALLYHYFDNKDVLVHATLRHAIDDFLVAFDDLPKDADAPLGAADAWIAATIDAAPRLTRMVKLMSDFGTQENRDAEALAMVDEFYARERETLRQAILEGIADGRFRQVDAERTARLTSIAIDGVFYGGPARNDFDHGGNLRDIRDQLLEFLARPG